MIAEKRQCSSSLSLGPLGPPRARLRTLTSLHLLRQTVAMQHRSTCNKSTSDQSAIDKIS